MELIILSPNSITVLPLGDNTLSSLTIAPIKVLSGNLDLLISDPAKEAGPDVRAQEILPDT